MKNLILLLLLSWIAASTLGCKSNSFKPIQQSIEKPLSVKYAELAEQEFLQNPSDQNYQQELEANQLANQSNNLASNKKPTLKLDQDAEFSLTAFESPVHELLFSLANQAGFDLEIKSGVEGLLTINLQDKTLGFILQRIANQLSLIISLEGNTLVVRPDEAYWQKYLIDYVNIKRSRTDSIVMNMAVGGSVDPQVGNDAMGSKSVIDISSENDFWLRLSEVLQQFQPGLVAGETDSNSAGLKVLLNPEAGLVMVHAGFKTQQQIAEYLHEVTKIAKRQVMIEASVVEVSLSEGYQAGIDWDNSGFINLKNRQLLQQSPESVGMADNIFTAKLGRNVGFDFTAGLKMLEEFGDVKVISSPKIMALNNQSALLKVVDNQVYFTVNVSRSSTTAGTDVTYSTSVHTVPVGFMMSITPFVNHLQQVSLNIRPTISRIIGNVADPNPDLKAVGVESLVPVIQEREMETMLRLNDLETAVIGGLIEDREEDLQNGIIGLSKIPLIGRRLFGSQKAGQLKTELVIFIRPIIVENPNIYDGDLQAYRQYFYPERLAGAL